MESTGTNTAFYDSMFPHCAHSLNSLEISTKTSIQRSLSDIDELNKRIRPLPALQMKLLDLLRKPDTHYLEIVDLINQDPSLALRVLKIVNSAQYTAGFEIRDLGTAVARLGMNGISDIVSALLMKSLHPPKPIYYKLYGKQIWDHSLHCAYLCKGFATALDQDGFTGYFLGLIHDIGKILVFECLVEALVHCDTNDEPGSIEFREFITEVSMDISYFVARQWNLPADICDALQQQRTGLKSPLAIALHCANACAEQYLIQDPLNGEDYKLPALAGQHEQFTGVWKSFLKDVDKLIDFS
jgi:HD-like signal output (HDOD) protein